MINTGELKLSSNKYDLLTFLEKFPGQILSQEITYKKIKGTNYDAINRSIDISISNIRSKVGDKPTSPLSIKTIRNKGYMLMIE
ncbi:winged helix-turn-helix domain-containing protein [Microbulbifer sp. VTAC004]|uniref:winged helix-turn-helix domain-containing protein n=1 Tax=Microbulbifer sp. VTAC004 TaxID=3243386 RepID=UPI004039DDE5